jgi:hypothetical protein
MKTINSLIAAALLASVAGPALADEGDYYTGANERASVDHITTGSIENGDRHASVHFDRGDYYEGAKRPN